MITQQDKDLEKSQSIFTGMMKKIQTPKIYEYLAEYHAHRIPRMSVDECG